MITQAIIGFLAFAAVVLLAFAVRLAVKIYKGSPPIDNPYEDGEA